MTAGKMQRQSEPTLAEVGDGHPGALFSQNTKDQAKTPVPCFLDVDVFFGERGSPLKLVLRVGKLSPSELRAGKKVDIDQGLSGWHMSLIAK